MCPHWDSKCSVWLNCAAQTRTSRCTITEFGLHFKKDFHEWSLHCAKESSYSQKRGVCEYDDSFVQWPNCIGELRLFAIQKCIATLQQLVYGTCANSMDKYCKLGENTSECLKWFVRTIVAFFQPMHLRKLIQVDIEQQLEINAKEGFPRMFVSFDYTHYECTNYLVS